MVRGGAHENACIRAAHLSPSPSNNSPARAGLEIRLGPAKDRIGKHLQNRSFFRHRPAHCHRIRSRSPPENARGTHRQTRHGVAMRGHVVRLQPADTLGGKLGVGVEFDCHEILESKTTTQRHWLTWRQNLSWSLLYKCLPPVESRLLASDTDQPSQFPPRLRLLLFLSPHTLVALISRP
jgi:hypothetical protein